MDFKDPKNQIGALIVLLFLVVLYLWYSKIYTVYDAKISAERVQLQNIRSALYNVMQEAATLEELQKKYEELQIKYKKYELLLPAKREDETFLNQLHAAAQLTGSVVKSVTPMGTESHDFYDANTYSVAIESSYHGLGRFFSKVANFPFIVNISDLELKSTSASLTASTTTQKDPNRVLIATFKMSTYNVKQGVSG